MVLWHIKGYRFWTRIDLKELQKAQLISVNHTATYPTEVHANLKYLKAEQMVECEVSALGNDALKAHVARLDVTQNLQNHAPVDVGVRF